MAETEIKTILTIDTGNSGVTINDLKARIKDLKTALQETALTDKDYQKTLDELRVTQNALKDAMYGQITTYEDLNKEANGLTQSYNGLVHQMAALKSEFRATTDEARRQQLGAQIKDINDQLKAMDALQGNFQRNVGNYTEGITKAFGRMKEGVDNFGKAAGVNINGVKDGFEALSKTPFLAILGLIVNLAFKLKDHFKEDEEAMKGINAALAVFKPLGNFLTAVLEKVSTFLVDIFGKVSAFIGSSGLMQQVINGVAGVGNAIAEFIIAPFRGIVAAIKVFREEGIKGIGNAARAFANEAKQGWTFKQNFQAGQTIADNLIKGFKSKKEEVKTAGKEVGKSFLEGISEEIDKEIESLGKEISDELSKAISDGLAADEKTKKNAADAASRLLEGLDKYTERSIAALDLMEGTEREKADKINAIQEEANRKRLELLKQFEQEAMQNGDLDAAFKYQQQAADLEYQIDYNTKKRKKELRDRDKADFKNSMQGLVSITTGVLSSLASIYESNDKASEKQLKRAKALKVASAIITTLEGAVAAYMSGVKSAIPPPGNIILGAAQAATVTAAGMANVAQIKRTNPGDTGSASVPAFQAPSVPTTMNTTRSITSQSEEDRLNYMARDQKVVLIMSELEAKQGQRQVQLAESSF